MRIENNRSVLQTLLTSLKLSAGIIYTQIRNDINQLCLLLREYKIAKVFILLIENKNLN